jgi:type 1 glutamine amidotransferase
MSALRHLTRRLCFCCCALIFGGAGPLSAAEIKVLFIDGQNNHNWFDMTPRMRDTLVATGRFTCDVATSPAVDDPGKAAKWEAFRPAFARYDVIVSNYGIPEPWPQAVRDDLVDFVRKGGGFVAVHAATNPFPDWKEYNEMIGLGWRGKEFGKRVTIDDKTGEPIETPAGAGPGAGHGGVSPYVVTVRRPQHPIMQGLPRQWMHAQDEVYHGQRGPALSMTVLSSAYSDRQQGGTGEHEPLDWVIPFGEGRVFVTMQGHVRAYDKYPLTFDAIQCVGFQTIFARGTEWAATGKVTIPVPPEFPTRDKLSIVPAGKLNPPKP